MSCSHPNNRKHVVATGTSGNNQVITIICLNCNYVIRSFAISFQDIDYVKFLSKPGWFEKEVDDDTEV